MSKAITRCPLCGGAILVSYLFQTSRTYKIGRSGRVNKKPVYIDRDMPFDIAIATCENHPDRCRAQWGENEFNFDEQDRFIDYKYSKGGQ